MYPNALVATKLSYTALVIRSYHHYSIKCVTLIWIKQACRNWLASIELTSPERRLLSDWRL